MPFIQTLLTKLRQLRHRAQRIFFYGHWMIGVVDQPIGNAIHWTQAPTDTLDRAVRPQTLYGRPVPVAGQQ